MFSDFAQSEHLYTICRYIGLFGFVLYMVGFAGLQLQLLDGNGYTYTTINILAALAVLIGLTFDFNIASALIQISWILIGLVGISYKITMKLSKRAMKSDLSTEIV